MLHTLVTAHPDYDITVLLRKTPDGFTSAYPNVKIVKGDYDSAEILSEQASKADIVVRTFYLPDPNVSRQDGTISGCSSRLCICLSGLWPNVPASIVS